MRLLATIALLAIAGCSAYADPAGTPRSRSALQSSGGSSSGVTSPLSVAVANLGFADAGAIGTTSVTSNQTSGNCAFWTSTGARYCSQDSTAGRCYFDGSGIFTCLAGGMYTTGLLSGHFLQLDGVLFESSVAPTVATSCTGESLTWSNGTAVFEFDVGTSCTGVSTATITMPSSAAHGWSCNCWNTGAATNIGQSGGSANTVVLTNYGTLVATPADWADGADVRCLCGGG